MFKNIINKIYIWLAERNEALQALLITFILFNFIMLYSTSGYTDFNEQPSLPDKIWFTIEGGIYPFLSVILVILNKGKRLKYIWLTLGIFFAIRWVCEIIVFALNWNIHKPEPIMAFMFGMTFCIIIFLTFWPYLRQLLWKNR